MNLNSKIENQKRGGKGDTLPSNDYYTNSYVERLKALGSPVQYSNYSNSTVNTKTLSDGRIYLQSVFIPKTSIISTIGWRQISTGIYTPDNYNGVGIYSMNTTTGDLTLLSKSVDDGTTWSTVSANAYGSKNLTTPVSLNKGIYFLAYLYNSSASSNAPSIGSDTLSLPSFSNMAVFNVPTNTFLTGYVDLQTDLPTSILSVNVTKATTLAANDILFYLS